MIFLKDNVLLERDLKFEDIKPRLLGRMYVGIVAYGGLTYNTRSLGNLPWAHSRILTSELPHPET
jgi:hypothetical protein